MMNSAVIREARRRAGLTQTALAELSGTTQSAIAAYETGAKEPSSGTMTRITAAAGFAVSWNLIETTSATAGAVQAISATASGGNEPESLRLAADLATRLGRLTPGGFLIDAAVDPGSTGDSRWDAMVAGIVERAAHQVGARVPAWTACPQRFLPSWWFVSPFRSLHASALVDSPPELANRGVFIHEASLGSI